MNQRILTIGTLIIACIIFIAGWATVKYSTTPDITNEVVEGSALIRPYSPVVGPIDAPVTIVEFFDPACEACRAIHPVIVDIRKRYPTQVRIVMRYAAFHDGSDIAVRVLETARLQNKFEPVLNALLYEQPKWASHAVGIKLDNAWDIAAKAGLDIEKAKKAMGRTEIDKVLNQDALDIQTLNVQHTPTFYIDGKPLLNSGPEQLMDRVRQQVESKH